MADDPGAAFTSAAQKDEAAVAGYYRMIEHPPESEVTPENILAPHRARTLRRMTGQQTVLLVQDGTDLNFATHPGCRGLGIIGKNKGSSGTLGLHMHTTLAVAADGVPLGVPRIEYDAPDARAERNKPAADRKSARWLRGLRDCAEMSSALKDVRMVSVMDREADFFTLFMERKRLGSVELLVRAKTNRALGEDMPKLFDSLRSAPVQVRLEIHVARASARDRQRRRDERRGLRTWRYAGRFSNCRRRRRQRRSRTPHRSGFQPCTCWRRRPRPTGAGRWNGSF